MKAKSTALAALVVVAAIAATAPQVRADDESGRGRVAIVGSWAETQTVVGGPSFLTLNTYGVEGVLISSAQGGVVTTGPFASSATPAQGQWIYQGGRTFSTTTVSIGSDLADSHLLYVLRIRATVTVDVSGNTYHAVGRTEVLDAAGNILFAFDSTNEGRRINVEPLN